MSAPPSERALLASAWGTDTQTHNPDRHPAARQVSLRYHRSPNLGAANAEQCFASLPESERCRRSPGVACAGSSLLQLGTPGSARSDHEVLALITFLKSMQQNVS